MCRSAWMWPRKYKESPEVIHAIEAHHNDVETPHRGGLLWCRLPMPFRAARPGARRENVENYIKRLEKLEEIAKSSFEGVETSAMPSRPAARSVS